MSKIAQIKPQAATEPESPETPTDIITMNLNEAHAILDLLAEMTSHRDCAELHMQQIGAETLNAAIYSAMHRIREALAATDKLWVQS